MRPPNFGTWVAELLPNPPAFDAKPPTAFLPKGEGAGAVFELKEEGAGAAFELNGEVDGAALLEPKIDFLASLLLVPKGVLVLV